MPTDVRLCQVCGSSGLGEVAGFAALPRVTSDCKPFRAGGKLAVCVDCGAAQAVADEQWLREIDEIYSRYDIYYQSGGQEQQVFDRSTGRMRPRSELLVDRLASLPQVPRGGKLLDVGCGNGETLKRFAERGTWELHGLDIHERNLERISAIPGFAKLHTCAPGDVAGHFDVITLIHALEHFPDPGAFLRQLRGKLRDGGVLFIQVPDAAANPIDHVVADHLLHFDPFTLTALLRGSGFDRVRICKDWVAKEISVLAERQPSEDGGEQYGDSRSSAAQVRANIAWLSRVIDAAQNAAKHEGPFGLFGSSIAATWLWTSVSERVEFFVDEDSTRISRQHLQRPILHPDQVPPGAHVFLGLAPMVAELVQQRLRGREFYIHMPPLLA